MAILTVPPNVRLFWFHGIDAPLLSGAIEAIRSYALDPTLPQHDRLGKQNGGACRILDKLFWVWRTKSGWHVSLANNS